MKRCLCTTVIVSCCMLLGQRAALAEKPRSPYTLRLEVELPVLAGAATLWIAPSIANRGNQAPTCDPCDPSGINALDREVIGLTSTGWDVTGDVLAVTLPALAGLGGLLHVRRDGWRAWGEDLLLVLEAMALSGALNQLVRHAVDRPRPFMYDAGARPELRDSPESFLSFYSGHTSTVFSGAAAFTTSYFIRRPEASSRWLVLAGAFASSSVMPLARVLSGEHFVTDVLTGAIVGTAIGVLVPVLHRRPDTDNKLRISLGASSNAAWGTLGGHF